MAKATAICTCKVCGATFEKTSTKANRRDADSWEAWAVENFDLCPACWAKQQREKEASEPLTLTVSLDPYNTEYPVLLIWSGNTMPSKDSIKALGYHYDELPSSGFLGILDMHAPRKGWSKRIASKDLEAALQEAKPLCGDHIENKISSIDLAAYQQIKSDSETQSAQKAAEKQAAIEALGPRPTSPDCLPKGRWNRTLYGSKRSGYSVYVDGQKVAISEEDAPSVQTYIDSSLKWDADKKAIEQGR